MLPIVLGVLVTISSLMLAFFLAVSNVSFIVEDDFMSKANQNAVLHALAEGQLLFRTGILGPSPTRINQTTENRGYLRDFHDGTRNNISYNITFDNKTENIDVDVKVK
jgi:hypothetical protein